MKPTRPITDKSFRYTPAAQTDLKKTFARIIAAQKRDAADRAAAVKAIPVIGKRVAK